MEKVANRLAEYLVRTQTIQMDRKEICAYGFQIGLEFAIAMSVTIASAAIMGMLVECLVILAIFFVIRGFAGGLHMGSFLSCFICSELSVLLALGAVRFIRLDNSVMIVTSILALAIIKLLSPVENDNRPVDACERKKFSGRLNVTIIVLIVLGSILYFTHNGYGLWIVVMGELMNVLSLTAGKIRYRRSR
ncbi:MAG: accessory gene regulator B family protein [Lachnospiraceae bacterium]|jgi:accessory gene regulator protein AgrB|nr:accessory gene regulator B family protein [Lachnospiraceae bacterium]